MVQTQAENVVQTAPKRMTFDKFIAWYPEDSEYRYELHEGLVVEMPEPRGKYAQVVGFIGLKLGVESERLGLSYFIPGHCLVKPDEEESGFRGCFKTADNLGLSVSRR